MTWKTSHFRSFPINWILFLPNISRTLPSFLCLYLYLEMINDEFWTVKMIFRYQICFFFSFKLLNMIIMRLDIFTMQTYNMEMEHAHFSSMQNLLTCVPLIRLFVFIKLYLRFIKNNVNSFVFVVVVFFPSLIYAQMASGYSELELNLCSNRRKYYCNIIWFATWNET